MKLCAYARIAVYIPGAATVTLDDSLEIQSRAGQEHEREGEREGNIIKCDLHPLILDDKVPGDI